MLITVVSYLFAKEVSFNLWLCIKGENSFFNGKIIQIFIQFSTTYFFLKDVLIASQQLKLDIDLGLK